jgi:hypothetical protein
LDGSNRVARESISEIAICFDFGFDSGHLEVQLVDSSRVDHLVREAHRRHREDSLVRPDRREVLLRADDDLADPDPLAVLHRLEQQRVRAPSREVVLGARKYVLS